MMRSGITLTLAVAIGLSLPTISMAQMSEQEIVNEYLKSTASKHTKKLGWFSVNFGGNRINKDNDYNKFVVFENSRFTGAAFSELGVAPILGLDFGVALSRKLAWTLGGEFWLNFGETIAGTFAYNPSGTPINVTNPSSDIRIWGVYTGVKYFLHNPPNPSKEMNNLSVHIGGTVGMYGVTWDLFPEFSNLNLATSAPAGVNTTFADQTIGLTMNLGIDYPIGFAGFVIGVDVDYLYLNFDQVAWYNSADQEIVASFNGNLAADSRVDLGFSGIRSKLQIKRFFTW